MRCGASRKTKANMWRWLFIAALVSAGCNQSGASRAQPAPAGVDVQHYDLSLRLQPASGEMEATAVLDVAHPDTLQTLSLALEDLTVEVVRVDGQAVDVQHRGGVLQIPLVTGEKTVEESGEAASFTTSQVEIRYHGRSQLGYEERSHDGQTVYFTDTWPDRARGWLPVIPHPSDPATFSLTLTLPIGYEAVASGTLVAVDTLAEAVRYQWRLTAPAPVYTYAFAVADFATVVDTAGTVPVRYVMLASDVALAAQLRRTPQAVRFFAELLGPYPFDEYAAVQVPIGYAGMENATAAFLQADLFHADAVEATQIHELAHQWFGNDVVIADWNHLWLSEGFATYLTSLFYEHADGLDAARQRWIEQAAGAGSGSAALVPPPGRPPGSYLTRVPYDKGASVLHLLRKKLGDAAFFAGLRTLYQQHTDTPITSDAVRAVFEAQRGQDLEAFFDYWVYGSAIPNLVVSWDRGTRTLTWLVEDDAGTLEGVPFELAVQQDATTQYVEASAGRITLDGTAQPFVQPVGVMLRVISR